MKKEFKMETDHSSAPLVAVIEAGAIVVVSLRMSSLIDAQTRAAVLAEIRAILRQTETPNILLDFHEAKHLSIGLLGGMKALAQDIETRGGTFRCCSLQKEMRVTQDDICGGRRRTGRTTRKTQANLPGGFQPATARGSCC